MRFPCYKECLRKNNILSFEEANQIIESIISFTGSNTIEGEKLIKIMVCSAIDYAGLRARWGVMSTLEMVRMNELRSQFHDLFIQSVDSLANYLEEDGRKIVWREKLGDDRKRIGDFACYITYIQGIDER